MIVNRKQLGLYLGVCRQTASKHYQCYIDILGISKKYITTYDIIKLDEIDETELLERLGVKPKKVNNG